VCPGLAGLDELLNASDREKASHVPTADKISLIKITLASAGVCGDSSRQSTISWGSSLAQPFCPGAGRSTSSDSGPRMTFPPCSRCSWTTCITLHRRKEKKADEVGYSTLREETGKFADDDYLCAWDSLSKLSNRDPLSKVD
jgi:hypothetical protein